MEKIRAWVKGEAVRVITDITIDKTNVPVTAHDALIYFLQHEYQ